MHCRRHCLCRRVDKDTLYGLTIYWKNQTTMAATNIGQRKNYFTRVVSNSATYHAGLRVGDQVLAINGVDIGESSDEEIGFLLKMYDLEIGIDVVYDPRAFIED